MAEGGRTNTAVEQRVVVLALACPSPSPGRRARVPRSTQFSPFIVSIPRGEDIGETIRVFFEGQKHNIQSSRNDLSTMGYILGISGDVTNPTVDVQGSTVTFEGIYSISTLSGSYIFHNDEPVQLEKLTLSFQSNNHFVAGSVVCPLIAGCAVQATVGCVTSSGR